MNSDCDIAVLGAGPAGVASALGLAAQGHRVALLHRPRRFPALEGLAERALASLRHLGCGHALSEVRIAARRSAYWNGSGFDGNREWLLDRAGFDRALLEDARAAGITLLTGRVGHAQWCSTHWRIGRNGPGPEVVRARFLIDARGRSAPRDRQGRRGPPTVALGRYWRLARTEATVTRILPFPDGWLWYAGASGGRAWVQLFVEARLPPRAHLSEHYTRVLERIPLARDWLTGATASGPPQARHAHMQCATTLVGERSARVGDAAFAIDPLSGHGIHQALAGALALIPTVHTLLARPANTGAALAFYRERIDLDFQRMARLGRDFYRQEQRWPERNFWRLRRNWPDDAPAHADPQAAPARIETRPVNCNGTIETREVIVSADQPRGVWQLDEVELVPLLRWYRQTQPADPAHAALSYADHAGRPPGACRQALQWLDRRGLLT